MADEEVCVRPQFVVQKLDRDILRGPTQSVDMGYFEDPPQSLVFQVHIFDDLRAMLTRTIGYRSSAFMARRGMDLHAARFMLEACRYRLAWTEYHRHGWIIMVHRSPLEEMVIAEPATESPPDIKMLSEVTVYKPLPDWARGIRFARIANENPGHPLREQLRALPVII